MLLYHFKAAAARAAAAILTVSFCLIGAFALQANASELTAGSHGSLFEDSLPLQSEPAYAEEPAVAFVANFYLSSFSKSTYNKYIEIENIYCADDRENGSVGRHNVGDRIPMYTIGVSGGTKYSAYCVEPGADVSGDWVYDGVNESDTLDLHWIKLAKEHPKVAENIKITVSCAKQYERDSEAKAAAQIIVWELLSGRRSETNGEVVDTSLYDAITPEGNFEFYYSLFDRVIAEYRSIPEFLSYSEEAAKTLELRYDSANEKYFVTAEDENYSCFEQFDWESFTGLSVSEIEENRVVLTSDVYKPGALLCSGYKDTSEYFNENDNAFLIFNSSDSGTRGQTLVCGTSTVRVPVYLRLEYEDVGFLKIEKSSEDEIVENVEFAIINDADESDICFVQTDESGIAEVTLLPGRYIISEKISSIYNPQAPQIVEITAGNTETVCFFNTLIPVEDTEIPELPAAPKDEAVPPVIIPETDDYVSENVCLIFILMACVVPLCRFGRCSGKRMKQ